MTTGLISAVADLESQKIDFTTYKGLIDAEMDRIEGQSTADKAAAFDKMFKMVRSTLTEQDEPYDGITMWYDSDSTHYVWEAVMTAIFGDDFFKFYNKAYMG